MVHDGVYTLYLPISGRLRSYYETLVLRLPHRTDPQKIKRRLPNLISEGDSGPMAIVWQIFKRSDANANSGNQQLLRAAQASIEEISPLTPSMGTWGVQSR